MGGNVPLGYDVKDRKLIVSEPEASTVRLIFRRYAELGSVSLLRAGMLTGEMHLDHNQLTLFVRYATLWTRRGFDCVSAGKTDAWYQAALPVSIFTRAMPSRGRIYRPAATREMARDRGQFCRTLQKGERTK